MFWILVISFLSNIISCRRRRRRRRRRAEEQKAWFIMQTSSPEQPFDSELHHLQYQLAAIQEQHRLQTYLIEQFQQQLQAYQDNERSRSAARTPFFYTMNQPAIGRSSSSDNDEDDCSTLSPLDLSSRSIKSEDDQSTSMVQFQMESHEGEPENPHMSKVCLNFSVGSPSTDRAVRSFSWRTWSNSSNERRRKAIRMNVSFVNACCRVRAHWKCTIALIQANVRFDVESVREPFRPRAIWRLTWIFIV